LYWYNSSNMFLVLLSNGLVLLAEVLPVVVVDIKAHSLGLVIALHLHIAQHTDRVLSRIVGVKRHHQLEEVHTTTVKLRNALVADGTIVFILQCLAVEELDLECGRLVKLSHRGVSEVNGGHLVLVSLVALSYSKNDFQFYSQSCVARCYSSIVVFLGRQRRQKTRLCLETAPC